MLTALGGTGPLPSLGRRRRAQLLLIVSRAVFSGFAPLASVAVLKAEKAMWNLVYALGRLALVAIFIQSGFGKLMAPEGLTGMLTNKGLPAPMALAYLAGVVELGLGFLVAIGWQTRLAGAGLIVFTIIATLIAHNFWDMADAAARRANQIHFMKNLAIIGALLMVMANGAGRYAVDRKGARSLSRDKGA